MFQKITSIDNWNDALTTLTSVKIISNDQTKFLLSDLGQ